MAFADGFYPSLKDARTQRALSNYGTDPDEAVRNYMAVDAPAAIGLQQYLAQQRATQAHTAQEQAAENRKRAYGAITGATDMLRSVRDKGGDVGAAYDQLDQGGILDTLGMSPQEKAHYRAAITANPGLIDVIGAKAAEGMIVTPGSDVVDKNNPRNVLYRNPVAPKPLVVRRGDGGSDVIYPNAPGSDGAAPMGGVPSIAAPAGNGSGTSRGDRNGNPGNLKDGPFARSQPGYLGSDGTFAKFSPGAGIAAQENLLQKRYFGRGINTVNGIVDTYLGSGNDENSVASRQNYKSYVAGRLGVDPSQPIPSTRLREFGQAMREFETGNTGGARRAPSAAPQNGAVYSTPGAPPKAKDAPAGYQYKADGNLEFIPGGPADPGVKGPGKGDKAKTQALAAADQIDSAVSAAQDLLNNKDIDSYLGNLQGRFPSWLSSGRNDFNRDLEALKTKVGINALQTMRAMSPTGGALGQVSDFENKMLQQSLASLDTTQSEDQFKKNLRTVIGSFQKMKQRLLAEAPNGDTAQAGAPVKVRTVQQAMALPPGTIFITPDGRRKVR